MQDVMPLQMLLLVGGLGLMVTFVVGSAMHGVIGEMGFGPLGNTLILASGFVLAIAVVNYLGDVLSLNALTASAISGAFVLLFLMMVVKRFLLRV